MNLSPKTTCLERPYFYGRWGGLSRQVLQCIRFICCSILEECSMSLVSTCFMANVSTTEMTTASRSFTQYPHHCIIPDHKSIALNSAGSIVVNQKGSFAFIRSTLPDGALLSVKERPQPHNAQPLSCTFCGRCE